MPTTLLFTALLMGLAGGPHCAAMCGAACAGLTRNGRDLLAFQAGRLFGYAALGAIAASAFQGLGWLTAASAAARPLWTLFHMGLLLLGLTLLWQARQPRWIEALGRDVWKRVRRFATAATPAGHTAHIRFTGAAAASVAAAPRRGSLPLLAGALWAFMPCGLLYSALMVAVLAGSAMGGALSMAVFALGSAVSLALGPWLWRHWQRRLPGDWGIRIAGALLAGFSAWALWMGDMARAMPWCAAP